MASQYPLDQQDTDSNHRLNRENVKSRMIDIREHLITDLSTARKDIESLSIEARGTEFEDLMQSIDTNFMRYKIQEIKHTINQFLSQ